MTIYLLIAMLWAVSILAVALGAWEAYDQLRGRGNPKYPLRKYAAAGLIFFGLWNMYDLPAAGERLIKQDREFQELKAKVYNR